jgi:2,3-bisphosphoglycerate-dependent phosphoglycerate mutase
MAFLVLVRHGQSQWNLENRFTGWVDVPLSEKGEAEAHQCAKTLLRLGVEYAVAHTSALLRAEDTLRIIMHDNGWRMPVRKDLALNERMYGDLQGMDKDEAKKRFGEKQVSLWRRSYDAAPPNGESLKDTAGRTWPYFKRRIMPDLLAGRNVLVVAHGNSLRSIVMHLEKLGEKDVLKLNIDTGVSYLYEMDGRGRVKRKEIL